jgi:hypothetical protein
MKVYGPNKTLLKISSSPKLFTKFCSKSFSGTGHALYISNNIIEDHGEKYGLKITMAREKVVLHFLSFYH